MRFQLQSAAISANRLGKLLVSDLSTDTPGCFLYTRYGSVPFLPPDIYECIRSLPNMAFVPMFYIAERKYVLKKFHRGLVSFCGLGSRAAIIFQTDPVDPAPVCASDKRSVSVWATGGRIQLSVEEYTECVLASLPSAYQTPVDNETALPVSKKAGKKRCSNSVIRTGGYLELLLQERRNNVNLAKIPVWVSLAGGNDLQWRLNAIKDMDFSVASGIILDGFSLPDEGDDLGTGEELGNKTYVNQSHWSNLLPKICQLLPPHLPRFLAGVWQPHDIAIATRLGIDLFDGSLPYRLTRSAIAWIYPGWSSHNNKHESIYRSSDGRHFFIVFPLDEANITTLTETLYTSPIQADCDCFACTRHTQGYISHLHVAKEMLGPMLLMIHNSHQYYRFFDDLRLAASTNRLEDFIQFVQPMRFPCDLLAVDRTYESKGVNDSTLIDATINAS
ncbi:hypothetical protein EG68_10168 [Paragonimus skrjabini miyazakii]|uniref:Queuine tRNA-ribosyltransferase accessory subunit 2 n=1 Tax=Paragonimus skrjabini miyazakii TaxID=59628 RepID=A0A8S9YQR2_9TREM|nr:hypothetical protein EG68_10168 [Paragonimus skrjabini miyazakii]